MSEFAQAPAPARVSGEDIIEWAQAGDVLFDLRGQDNPELRTPVISEAIIAAVSAHRVEQVRQTLGNFLARCINDVGSRSLRIQKKERDLSEIYSAATGLEAPPLASSFLPEPQ